MKYCSTSFTIGGDATVIGGKGKGEKEITLKLSTKKANNHKIKQPTRTYAWNMRNFQETQI